MYPVRAGCSGLVVNLALQLGSLGNPILHLLEGGQLADKLLFGIDFHNLGVQVFGLALRQFHNGITHGFFQQVGIFAAKLLDAVQVAG